MRISRPVPILLAVLLAVPLSGFSVERKLKLEEVPAPVRAALEQQAKGGTIIDVDVNDESGSPVYTSEIHKGKDEIDVRVAPDGKVLSVENGNTPASPPPAPSALELVNAYRFWIIGIVGALLLLAMWIKRQKREAA